MTISNTLLNPWTRREANRVESFLRSLGVQDQAYFAGSVESAIHTEAPVVAAIREDMTRFTIDDTNFLVTPYESVEPLCLPFLAADFGLSAASLVTPDVPLTVALDHIEERGHALSVAVQIDPGGHPVPDEGYVLRTGESTKYMIYSADRGELTPLSMTDFAWTACLDIALRENYRHIDWASFNPT